MGITAQICELLHFREICLEIGEEATGRDSVAGYGTGSQCGGQSLDTGVKKFTESKVGELGGALFRESLVGREAVVARRRAMDEGRSLQGVTRILPLHMPARQFAQLRVNQRHNLLERGAVADRS